MAADAGYENLDEDMEARKAEEDKIREFVRAAHKRKAEEEEAIRADLERRFPGKKGTRARCLSCDELYIESRRIKPPDTSTTIGHTPYGLCDSCRATIRAFRYLAEPSLHKPTGGNPEGEQT